MDSLNTRVYQPQDIYVLEKLALNTQNIPARSLMERAAHAALKYLQELWPKARTIGIVCGRGNNGGDGYALALLAQKSGYTVFIGDEGPTVINKEPAAFYQKACLESSIKHFPLTQSAWPKTDLWVDALLGIGLQRGVEGLYRATIQKLNQQGTPILSLDCPSGLESVRGAVMGAAVYATATITFIGLKVGLLTGAAPSYCGKLRCDNLELPESIYQNITPTLTRLNYDKQKPLLAPRKGHANKGDFGHVLVIGGDEGMPGAPILAADAAYAAGAGLVTVATRPQHLLAVAARRPEALVCGIEDVKQLKPLLARATVIVLGPGLGQSAWSEALFQAALKTNLPVIVDADALNLLALQPRENQRWLLTPHPGEAARLLNVSVQEIQDNRLHALKQLQHRYGGNVILKGAGSLIINTQEQIFVCSAGHPAMASAGMGDALSGVLAALVAQGLSLADAAPLGVYAHAYAGEKAASDGKRSILASDLRPYLQTII